MERVGVWFCQLRRLGGLLKRLAGYFSLGCRNSSEPVDLLDVAVCGPSCRGDVVKESHDLLLEVSGQ